MPARVTKARLLIVFSSFCWSSYISSLPRLLPVSKLKAQSVNAPVRVANIKTHGELQCLRAYDAHSYGGRERRTTQQHRPSVRCPALPPTSSSSSDLVRKTPESLTPENMTTSRVIHNSNDKSSNARVESLVGDEKANEDRMTKDTRLEKDIYHGKNLIKKDTFASRVAAYDEEVYLREGRA